MTGTVSESPTVTIRSEPPLAQVTLADSSHGNRITPEVRTALPAALREAAANPSTHVIVLAGLPGVFCAGGTLEDLTANEDVRTPQGWDFVRAAADCPLPVVVAAQGHAIGGGLLLALYADVTVLSETSSYAANFLTYGFTPCLGATHVLPAVLGQALGTEMLYTARPYRGRELAARGAGVTVAPHDEVLPRAHALARRIAQAPRRTLELLKQEMAAPARQLAQAALERELVHHTTTLTAPETQRRIAELYPRT
ncbi:polyketide synthase [Streptomyces sp. NPDC006654]|uniref:polyketide synthase n=1 Tax=Streptomyces sp. NPDC006654 TaxID=3156897 RepID=UPI00340717F3